MSFPEHEIDRIRRDADLKSMIEAETTLKKAGRFWSGCCPFHDEKNPSFVFDPLKNTFRCYSSGCGKSGSVIDWVIETEGLSFVDAIKSLGGEEVERDPQYLEEQRRKARKRREETEDKARQDAERQRKKAFDIFRAAQPIAGSVAEVYLREARGLEDVPLLERVLRFVPSLPYWGEVSKGKWEVIHSGPAMVAAFQRPDGTFAAVHQTWLMYDGSGKVQIFAPNGSKLPAKKIKGPFSGASICLSEPAPIMGTGEGIETSLSAVKGGLSAWCAGSKGNLVGLGLADGERKKHPTLKGALLPTEAPDLKSLRCWLPEGTKTEIIIADNDTKDLPSLGAELARAKARAIAEGRAAGILWPPEGEDLNDSLLRLNGKLNG